MGHPEAAPPIIRPVWQNGTPQSMQRAPCSRSASSGECRWNSCQSEMRSAGGRTTGSVRVYSMNPVGLPISYCRFLRTRISRRTISFADDSAHPLASNCQLAIGNRKFFTALLRGLKHGRSIQTPPSPLLHASCRFPSFASAPRARACSRAE